MPEVTFDNRRRIGLVLCREAFGYPVRLRPRSTKGPIMPLDTGAVSLVVGVLSFATGLLVKSMAGKETAQSKAADERMKNFELALVRVGVLETHLDSSIKEKMDIDAKFEERLTTLRLEYERRLTVTEGRVDQLEKELGATQEENRGLVRQNIDLTLKFSAANLRIAQLETENRHLHDLLRQYGVDMPSGSEGNGLNGGGMASEEQAYRAL